MALQIDGVGGFGADRADISGAAVFDPGQVAAFQTRLAEAEANQPGRVRLAQAVTVAPAPGVPPIPLPPQYIPGTPENQRLTNQTIRGLDHAFGNFAENSGRLGDLIRDGRYLQAGRELMLGFEPRRSQATDDPAGETVLMAAPKPDGVPAGTLPIDQAKGGFGLDKDDVHKIKQGLQAGPTDWVGIDPDGNVWTADEDGQGENNGHYGDYLP